MSASPLAILVLLGLGLTSCHRNCETLDAKASTTKPSTSVQSPSPVLSASASASASAAASVPPVAPSASAAQESSGPCPSEMLLVGRSCVDKWEAHLEELKADGTTAKHPYYERPKSESNYKAVSSEGEFPQGYISRPEAQKACEQAGKRLCTLGEWYRACQGPRGLRFPYGMKETPGKCNTRKAHLLSRMYGSNSRAWKYEEHFNNPILNQQEGFLSPSGKYADCASGGEVFDMVGNLHEWVSDTVNEDLPHKIPLQDNIRERVPHLHGHGIFMGGFYSTGREHGVGCGFITIGHEPSYHDYSTGFRCCRKAQADRSSTGKRNQ